MPTLFLRPPSRRLLPLLAAWALPIGGLLAGTDTDSTTDASKDKSVPETMLDQMVSLDVLQIEGSYVGSSGFLIKEFNGAGTGTQANYKDTSETEAEIEYGHRFHLFDKVYLRLGVDYQRFDFSQTTAPVPLTLENLSALIMIEYVVDDEPGVFLRTRPGVFTSSFNAVHMGSIDAPTDAGLIFPGTKIFSPLKSVYFLAGVHYSALTKYPVLPFGGMIWLIEKNLRLEAVPPEPRLIYTVSKELDFFAGGEILGESYKRADDPSAREQFQRFNGGVIDFTEYRAGAGMTYSPIKQVDIDLSGGWDFERNFDYYRGDASKEFEMRGAPYAKLSVDAKF